MSKDIQFRKGFQLQLKGEADKILSESVASKMYAIRPDDFFGIVPKLTVKEGDKVKKGTPLFFSKQNPEVQFVSPVSGEITSVVRGERRKVLEVIITEDDSESAEKFEVSTDLDSLSSEQVKDIILKSGSWNFIKQRPYGIIADPKDTPKSIFISTYSTRPLDVDYCFILKNNVSEFQKGINVLKKITSGNINIVGDKSFQGFVEYISNANIVGVKGSHPAGNISFHIREIDPLNFGEKIWTINPEDVVNIGRLFSTGEYSPQRTVAVVGSVVENPRYFKTKIGASIASLLESASVELSQEVRVVNGDLLSGTSVSPKGYLGYYNSLLSLVREGKKHRMFGWMPFVDNHIPSFSRTSLFGLLGDKKSDVDTNLNGEERALVVTGEMEKVFPIDIYPMQLIKACLINDIERMEALGIYEVVPEDFGLIDYSSTSKIEAQEIIRKGIELMIKEVG